MFLKHFTVHEGSTKKWSDASRSDLFYLCKNLQDQDVWLQLISVISKKKIKLYDFYGDLGGWYVNPYVFSNILQREKFSQLFQVKDVPGGFPKSDLLGVTVALIADSIGLMVVK